jgi:hypothetical protein
MGNVIAFFKRIIEFVLKMLFGKKTTFNTFDGNELITSDTKIFLIKGEN